MTETDGPIVIVGGGHAAAQLCAGLAAAGQGARVHLVCAEPVLPYQRPPLSKSFLKSPQEVVQLHRPEDWWASSGIQVHLAKPAVDLSLADRRVQLQSGASLPFAWLVLATGTRARRLPGLATELDNVLVLRNAADALTLRERLATAQQVTVLGGGFIGLEIAATAAALGKQVTVLESAPRLLSRSVSPELAAHVLQTHRDAGIDLRLGVRVGEFEVDGKRLTALGVDGVRVPVELLIMGIGAQPEMQLAEAAGLSCDNGIRVDACMRTSAPGVLAAGDCCNFPEAGSGRRLRLESVQNANDQARTALATLLGKVEPYKASPWFWSDQGSLRLQIAGLMADGATQHRRAGSTANSLSILHYRGEHLCCVESVNAPHDHIAARKLLELGKSPAAAVAADPAVALKSLV
ncbi:MAG: FAD-dependent oxidoreductase [Rubrivivax sp.]|nr:FAD-dependent oxidoreductase [Rubrivivax sp.]